MSVETWWMMSIRLFRSGHVRTAKLVKGLNFATRHALLPFQAEVDPSVTLEHHGLGVVIHPNVTIGKEVKIWHNVTIAAETVPGSPHRVYIGDRVTIGAGAIIVSRTDRGLVVGEGAYIGAGAVVTKDVAPFTTVVGTPARPTRGA